MRFSPASARPANVSIVTSESLDSAALLWRKPYETRDCRSKTVYPVIGGVERYGFEIVKAYVEEGDKVDLISGVGEVPDLGENSSQIATHYVFNSARFLTLRLSILVAQTLLSRYRSSTFIHATTRRMALVPSWVELSRLVITVHGSEFLRTDLLSKVLMQWTYKCAFYIRSVQLHQDNV